MKRGVKARNAWEDRFQTPRVEDLLGVFTKAQLQLIEQARESILSLGGVSETISWLGIPWRWTLAFEVDGASERPWVYIIPQPGKPILALPMRGELVRSLSNKRLPKFVRDVMVMSPKVAGVHWMQWELTGRGQVEELVSLAKHQHGAVLSPAM